MKIELDKKDTVNTYMTLYMSIGMCFGISGGFLLGMILDRMIMGMCFGLPIGMCIGMVIGSFKDKRLTETMMKISKIETTDDETSSIIYVLDKDGIEKKYRIKKEMVKEQKFTIGDRVFEESDGSLLSLESK